MGRIIVHSLCFNTPKELDTTLVNLKKQNPLTNYEHHVIDLGFPLVNFTDVPQNVEVSKHRNTDVLRLIAASAGSSYHRIENVGVSQNWTSVAMLTRCDDGDILIGADCDERPQTEGWVQAMMDVITADPTIAVVSLRMKEQDVFFVDQPDVYTKNTLEIGGHKCFELTGPGVNWALIGISGKFLKEAGGVGVPKGAPRYGFIEVQVKEDMKRLGYREVVLADFYVEHVAAPPLYCEWKQYVASQAGLDAGQPDFQFWLQGKINDKAMEESHTDAMPVISPEEVVKKIKAQPIEYLKSDPTPAPNPLNPNCDHLFTPIYGKQQEFSAALGVWLELFKEADSLQDKTPLKMSAHDFKLTNEKVQCLVCNKCGGVVRV